MTQRQRIATLVILTLVAVIVPLVMCQPWRMNDDQIQTATGGVTYNLFWDKQLKFSYDGYDPGWKLVLREEIRQNGQTILSHLTETGIGGLVYGPGTPTPTAPPSGNFGSLAGHDFDLSDLSGRAELWACLHWEAAGEMSLFVELEGLIPDENNFYFVRYVNLPYTIYLPIMAKGE